MWKKHKLIATFNRHIYWWVMVRDCLVRDCLDNYPVWLYHSVRKDWLRKNLFKKMKVKWAQPKLTPCLRVSLKNWFTFSPEQQLRSLLGQELLLFDLDEPNLSTSASFNFVINQLFFFCTAMASGVSSARINGKLKLGLGSLELSHLQFTHTRIKLTA